MIKHLVIGSTDKFNIFPAKNGISDYYSPETLVTGRVFDYNKHCQFEFGDYVQGNDYNDPRNDMRPRTIDGIYCRPTENGKGHYLMDLQTGREVTRGGPITVIPLTETVKKRVEQMAKKQGHDKLKFKKST